PTEGGSNFLSVNLHSRAHCEFSVLNFLNWPWPIQTGSHPGLDSRHSLHENRGWILWQSHIPVAPARLTICTPARNAEEVVSIFSPPTRPEVWPSSCQKASKFMRASMARFTCVASNP